MDAKPLGWLGILRLGLVQMSLGALVVLMADSTLNRVMIVELHLPSVLPAGLIALHYAVEILRPRWGYGSDVGGRRTPWIIGGMTVLALGAVAAAASTTIIVEHRLAGIALAVAGFVAIGAGVGAAGTCVLVLLTKRTAPAHRAPAATIVWIMMILGLAGTAIISSAFLDPFTPIRLVQVEAVIASLALMTTWLALRGLEPHDIPHHAPQPLAHPANHVPFFKAARQVLAEPNTRQFMLFIFVSMLAFKSQALILEPFSGLVHALTPGQSTKLTGIQQVGILLGMVLVAVTGLITRRSDPAILRLWATGGCLVSALTLVAIAAGALWFPSWPFRLMAFALGVSNGALTIAAIGSMMNMVGEGHQSREGIRMGLWGAAQGIAFGLGGFSGALAVDIARATLPSPAIAYSSVFTLEACVFLCAAMLATHIGRAKTAPFKSSIDLSFASHPGSAVS